MTTLSPGDRVTTIIGGRKEGGTVVYVRGDSVRVALPGRTVTRPIARVKRVETATTWVSRTADDPATLIAAGVCEVTRVDHEKRTVTVDLVPHLRPVPKPPKPLRDAAYMKWVRDEHACCIAGCGMPAEEAHHHGPRGMGQKTDDYRVLPLCARCHREFHDTGTIDGMPREDFDAFAAGWQASLMFDYLRVHGRHGAIVDALVEAIRRTK